MEKCEVPRGSFRLGFTGLVQTPHVLPTSRAEHTPSSFDDGTLGLGSRGQVTGSVATTSSISTSVSAAVCATDDGQHDITIYQAICSTSLTCEIICPPRVTSIGDSESTEDLFDGTNRLPHRPKS